MERSRRWPISNRTFGGGGGGGTEKLTKMEAYIYIYIYGRPSGRSSVLCITNIITARKEKKKRGGGGINRTYRRKNKASSLIR